MTLGDALARCRFSRPGSKAEDDFLLRALSEIEGRVWTRVGQPHGFDPPDYAAYPEADRGTVLAVPDPFSRLYVNWLCAAVDLLHGDGTGYNREVTLCGSLLDEYEAAVVRGPGSEKIRYW